MAVCVGLLAAAVVAGCSNIDYFVPDVPTLQAGYRAYGDSITHGYLLSDPLAQSYPALVAEYEGATFANNALDGDQACDLATRQIFPHQDSPTLASHPTYTVLIGTNDVDNNYIHPSYQTVFTLCHRAVLSWLAMPAEYKVLAGSKNVKASGPAHLDTSNHWNAWTTAGKGASISFSITTASAGPIYAWPRIDDNSTATYTYALDGDEIGSLAVQTNPKIATRNGSANSLSFLRIGNVPAGPHVVTFTQTSDGSNGVSVVGIGAPLGSALGQRPIVLAGTIPFQHRNPPLGYICSNTDPVCMAYVTIIKQDVALFAADGLDVRLFDTRKYMFGTAAEMSDYLHPNALGQKELSHSVEAVW